MKNGKIFAISSQKGGVGKTTTAVNLSAAISLANKECLLVDLDPQGNATSGVGIARTETSFLRECLIDNKQVNDLIRQSACSGLSILPSSPDLSDLDLHKSIKDKKFKAFQKLIDRLSGKFEYIIFDCPPSTGLLPELAFISAHKVLIPVQCEYYAMEGLSQILPEIETAKKTVNKKLEIGGLLLTMFDEELELSHEVTKEVKTYFPELVFETIIPRDVSLAESSSHGQSIFSYDIESRGAWAYICLAKEVLGHE